MASCVSHSVHQSEINTALTTCLVPRQRPLERQHVESTPAASRAPRIEFGCVLSTLAFPSEEICDRRALVVSVTELFPNTVQIQNKFNICVNANKESTLHPQILFFNNYTF